MMPTGISLHVGVNSVRDTFPVFEDLVGCENDAKAMFDIAESRNFSQRKLLLGRDAKYRNVEMEIRAASDVLKAGDIFLFTFAGHGSAEADANHEEPDNQDETILLSDFMLFDDVLERGLWAGFDPGVRILMVSDSCHSGSVSGFLATDASRMVRLAEQVYPGDFKAAVTTGISVAVDDSMRVRTISEEAKREHLATYSTFYEKVFKALPPPDAALPIRASVLLLAACRDDEDTRDGLPHGVFTQALLDVWKGGNFSGNYDDFIRDIGTALQGQPQTPIITASGQPNPTFRGQRPFSI